MDIGTFLRNIFGKKQALTKGGLQRTLLTAHRKFVPIEVIQQEQQIDGNPENNNTSKRDKNLTLCLRKEPNSKYVNERRFVEWVNLGDSACARQIPQPCILKYSLRNGFRVGKMKYRSLSELQVEVVDQERQLYRDIYGRIFAEIKERFPCFDSFDYLTERRYFHWLYLTENGALFLVYYEDQNDMVIITEDVKEIQGGNWREMVRLGWVKDVETQTIPGFLGGQGKVNRKQTLRGLLRRRLW